MKDFHAEAWQGTPHHNRSVDIRYRGQGYELNLPLTKNLLADFEQEHKRRYGYTHPTREVELVTLRLRAILKSPQTGVTTAHVGTGAFARPGRAKLGRFSWPKAPVLFDSKKLPTKLYSRDDLTPNQKYPGPAIITEYSATTVIPPGKRFHVDKAANLSSQSDVSPSVIPLCPLWWKLLSQLLISDENPPCLASHNSTTGNWQPLSSYNIPVKPSIFVVEDDPDISRLVRHHLENEGFTVRVYPTGTNVLADAERQRPALFVLDIMVPGKDGLEICRTIRQTTGLAAVPVIFLTAKSSEADRVLGLELGADDYIAKPFSPRELVARVKAVLRRFERPLPPSPVKVGEIEIDPSAMTLTVSGNLVATTATEFRLLDYFARHKGRVFSRDHLLDSVWRDTSYVTPRSVDVYVRRIREKIEPDPENPRYLKTVRGAGYRFEGPK